MTHEEALGQIYAMRESVANGWVPGPEHDFAFAMIDMLDEYKLDAGRYRWLRDAGATFYTDVDTPAEIKHHVCENAMDQAIDAARSNHEPF